MQLPTALQTAIQHVTGSLGLDQLIEAREELTKRYRHPIQGSPFMTSDPQRQSYVISRMPATFAALQLALKAVTERGSLPIKSLLDLGAGPGTAMWAACGHFPEIEAITLLEKDNALLSLGKQLAQGSENKAMQQADWLEKDLEQLSSLPLHDMVVMSYSIGEVNPNKMEGLLDLCFEAAKELLLIVEPGTPAGFKRIALIRDHLIKRGAYVIAPCPHQSPCPMKEGDWCHFSARVERTSLHKRLKGGSLGYEDEKFSYIAVAKTLIPLPGARILRQPIRHCGHTEIRLCTPNGVQNRIISKKMGPLYQEVRKADWGDSFSPVP